VVNPTAGAEGGATFVSKANLTDVTDPLSPISLGGALELLVSMTDNGEPGSSDTISIALWDKSKLVFSSYFDGAKTVEQTIGGGNLQVHTDALALLANQVGGSADELTDARLHAAVADAVAYWTDQDRAAAIAHDLRSVYVGIQDLEGPLLGLASMNLGAIWIDRDGAGAGWGTGGYDLESALKHEFGHMLGFDHEENPQSIMSPVLELGVGEAAGWLPPSPTWSRDGLFSAWSQVREFDQALDRFLLDGGIAGLGRTPRRAVRSGSLSPLSDGKPSRATVNPGDADDVFAWMDDDWRRDLPIRDVNVLQHSKRSGDNMGQ